MTDWTERYLEVALSGIPAPSRTDVERELRSSISDAIEERVAGGEAPEAAERAVLEGLGDPAKLAAAYSGRPNFLVGPELFPIYRHIVPRLIIAGAPLAAIVVAALDLVGGGTYRSAVSAAIGAAIGITIQIGFWSTVIFVALEQAEAMRSARSELARVIGPWTLEHLPRTSPGRVRARESIGEMIGTMIAAGALVFVWNTPIGTGDSGIRVLDPGLDGLWIPAWLAILAVIVVVQAAAFLVGRWTYALAGAFTVLQVAFAGSVVVLALQGALINPAFADQIGWPPLASGNGPAMLLLAVGTTLGAGLEIGRSWLRARRGAGLGSRLGAPQRQA